MNVKQVVKKIPVVGYIAGMIYRALKADPKFSDSETYWIKRYNRGGNSGAGSYNHLAEFKAEVINGIVSERGISTVIEYGCGDGNQLTLAKYPSYIGFDVSPKAIKLCRTMFKGDHSKVFKLVSDYAGEKAALTLSLDVIYHLVEDEVYQQYMQTLFDSAERMVIVYSSDFEAPQDRHERRRKFTTWVEANRPDWKLVNHIPNRYPYTGNHLEGSSADFYVYEKV
jgi:hypothetical protein